MTIKNYAKYFIQRVLGTYWILFRVIFPTMIIIKIATEYGVIDKAAELMSPVLSMIGLPGEAAIVWATAIFTNLFVAVAVFSQLVSPESWTLAQVSVIGLMMLFAHELPLECTVARLTGLPIWYSLILRLGTALGTGFLVMYLLSSFNIYQGAFTVPFEVSANIDNQSLSDWTISLLRTLGTIFLIVAGMTLVLDVIKFSGFDRFISRLLSPILRSIGSTPAAADMTIIGLTLGLSYGAGMMIQEAKDSTMSPQDRTSVMSFISLSHSLIEDTLVVAFMGGALSILLGARLFFTLLIALSFRFFSVYSWISNMRSAQVQNY